MKIRIGYFVRIISSGKEAVIQQVGRLVGWLVDWLVGWFYLKKVNLWLVILYLCQFNDFVQYKNIFSNIFVK